MTKIIRKADTLYLLENRYKQPKEIFKFLSKKIKKIHKNQELCNLADIGCAAGEFLYHLKKNLENVKLYGFDSQNLLLNKARKNVKNVNFIKKSILGNLNKYKDKYDVSTCVGVISIFDNFEIPIKNLIKITKPGGKIFLQALINDFPIDVNIKYSKSKNWLSGKPKYLESGWNIISRDTLIKFLKKNKEIKNFKIYDIKHTYNQKRNIADPMRSWTVTMNRKKKIINGLNLLIPEKIVEISLRDFD
jgi:2-polyprenyl-3-methyl-5-hydroxy-6-metoxy-1,4-benzoquinol methylase